jgi:hypothetical protein
MSWPLRHAVPAGLAGGLFMTLISAGAAAACPAHNPCPASAGGYYGGTYQQSSGYREAYGYEQAYVSDGYGARGYVREYGPYRQDYGDPPAHPVYPPPAYGPPAYGPPAYGPPAYPPAYPPAAYGPCCRPCVSVCGQGDGLVLSDSFFAGAGGVGPIPAGGYGGGGYYVVGAGGGSASAYASASASASASARISIHGGYRGGHGGGYGGKGHGGGKGH